MQRRNFCGLLLLDRRLPRIRRRLLGRRRGHLGGGCLLGLLLRHLARRLRYLGESRRREAGSQTGCQPNLR